MSNINCEACSELRENAPEFVQNGVTDTVCTSLKNDTGFNPNLATTHTDCEDLDLANDCLVGRMDQELEAYDVCDWKKFMHKFIPNLWELLKAFVCSICGLWTNVHDLDERADTMCALIEATMQHPVQKYGILNNDYGDSHPNNRGGVIVKKNGEPLMVPVEQENCAPSSWRGQNVGIRWGKMRINSCKDGSCKWYEWIAPDLMAYYLNSNASAGDIVWYVDKATAMGWGITQELWDAYTESSWTWTDYGLRSNKTYGWFRLNIEPDGVMGPDYLILEFLGTSYPDTQPGKTTIQPPEEPDKLYIWGC